jgi:hypothetical protein
MRIFRKTGKEPSGPKFVSEILALSETAGNGEEAERHAAKTDRFFVDREGNMSIFEASTIEDDVIAKGDLWMGKNSTVSGRVQIEGDLIMEANARILGSAFVKGSAHFKENAVIAGEVNIIGAVYRGNNPPEHMFRNRRRGLHAMKLKSSMETEGVENEIDRLIDSDKLQTGTLVIVQERKTDLSYSLIRRFAATGTPCMIIGREPPERVRSVRMIEIEDEQVLWLTTLVGRRCVNPTHLGSIQNTIGHFIDSSVRGVVLIDGVEYLISNNGFEAVLRFINKIEDMIITTGTTVVVSIDPRTLDAMHLALIERGAETIYRQETSEQTGGTESEIEERLKEETVRRQQLEDRLDEYLSRIENAIMTVKAGTQISSEGHKLNINELEAAKEAISQEVARLEENLKRRETELISVLEHKIESYGARTERNASVEEMERQLKDNSELLLKAVLLAEKLSLQRRDGSAAEREQEIDLK